MLAACMLNWPQKFKLWKVHAILYARRQFYLQVLCNDELAYMDIREYLCFCIVSNRLLLSIRAFVPRLIPTVGAVGDFSRFQVNERHCFPPPLLCCHPEKQWYGKSF